MLELTEVRIIRACHCCDLIDVQLNECSLMTVVASLIDAQHYGDINRFLSPSISKMALSKTVKYRPVLYPVYPLLLTPNIAIHCIYSYIYYRFGLRQ